MPKEIQFPDSEPRYVFDRDCLEFRALADGKVVECLVSGELLFSRFGAKDMSEEAMRQAFREHRAELEAIAREHIANGWIEDEGRIFLTRWFTQLSVHFDESLARDERVAGAHQILVSIIGPRAGEVAIEWSASRENPPHPSIFLRISDPAIHREVATALPVKVLNDPSWLRARLAFAWGDLLSARSHDHIIKIG